MKRLALLALFVAAPALAQNEYLNFYYVDNLANNCLGAAAYTCYRLNPGELKIFTVGATAHIIAEQLRGDPAVLYDIVLLQLPRTAESRAWIDTLRSNTRFLGDSLNEAVMLAYAVGGPLRNEAVNRIVGVEWTTDGGQTWASGTVEAWKAAGSPANIRRMKPMLEVLGLAEW